MKPKYYFSNTFFLLILTLCISVLLYLQTAQAFTLDSSGANPAKVFKCQDSLITANFSNFAAITAVTVWVNSSGPIFNHMSSITTQQESLNLADQGAGRWAGTFPKDSTRFYGNRTLSYKVTAAGITTTNTTNTYIIIFSDTCTGTGTNYTTQVTNGLGHYTSMIWRGEVNLLEFSLIAWTGQWGYLFYLIVLFIIVIAVYMKSDQITQPVIIACLGLGLMAGSTAIPDAYRQYIVMLLGVSLGALFYRIYIKR